MSVDFQMRMKFSSHILPTTFNLMQAAGVRYSGRRDMIWDSSRLPVLENTWRIIEYIVLEFTRSIEYTVSLYLISCNVQHAWEYTVSICTLYLVMFSVIYRVSICTLYPVMFSLKQCIYLYLICCNVQFDTLYLSVPCILYNVQCDTLYLSVPYIL